MTTPSWSPQPHVATSDHDHGIVLFDAERGQLFTANRVGARVWHLIERGLCADRIADELQRDYGLPASTARIHAGRFIAQLEQRRLIARRIA